MLPALSRPTATKSVLLCNSFEKGSTNPPVAGWWATSRGRISKLSMCTIPSDREYAVACTIASVSGNLVQRYNICLRKCEGKGQRGVKASLVDQEACLVLESV